MVCRLAQPPVVAVITVRLNVEQLLMIAPHAAPDLQHIRDRNDGHDEDELADDVAFDDDVETDEFEECRRLSEEM